MDWATADPFILSGHNKGFPTFYTLRLTGATPRQLRYWDQIGLVKPSIQGTGGRPGTPRLYGPADIIELRGIIGLLWRGCSLQSIRAAVAADRIRLDHPIEENERIIIQIRRGETA